MKKIRDYGDIFHAAMDICIDVQFNGKDHVDAAAEIADMVSEAFKYHGIDLPLLVVESSKGTVDHEI